MARYSARGNRIATIHLRKVWNFLICNGCERIARHKISQLKPATQKLENLHA